MGVIELELGRAIEAAAKKGDIVLCEKIMRKMALVIERQAVAISTIRWSEQQLTNANNIDKWLFEEIQELQK